MLRSASSGIKRTHVPHERNVGDPELVKFRDEVPERVQGFLNRHSAQPIKKGIVILGIKTYPISLYPPAGFNLIPTQSGPQTSTAVLTNLQCEPCPILHAPRPTRLFGGSTCYPETGGPSTRSHRGPSTPSNPDSFALTAAWFPLSKQSTGVIYCGGSGIAWLAWEETEFASSSGDWVRVRRRAVLRRFVLVHQGGLCVRLWICQ